MCTDLISHISQSMRGTNCSNSCSFLSPSHHVKVVRLQPLAALLMNLFLASSPLSNLKLWEEKMRINLVGFFVCLFFIWCLHWFLYLIHCPKTCNPVLFFYFLYFCRKFGLLSKKQMSPIVRILSPLYIYLLGEQKSLKSRYSVIILVFTFALLCCKKKKKEVKLHKF